MSAKIWLVAILCLPGAALGDEFTSNASFGGVHWSFTMPPGYHVIDTPESLALGATIRLSNSEDCTSEHPVPGPGRSLLAIDFTAPASPENMAALRQRAPTRALSVKQVELTVTEASRVVGDHLITITVATNGDADTGPAVATILNSLAVVP